MSKEKVLLINDLAGYGKVAIGAMIPVLSHMQYDVCSLPTALVSNTLDYGKFEILETTGYMKNTLAVWEQLGFGFDAVSTGFILSAAQTELVLQFCREQKKKGARIFTDPIMGDEGKLYNGVSEKTVELMRSLIAEADYILPNLTEACALTGRDFSVYATPGSRREELFSALLDLCPHPVLTGADEKDGISVYYAGGADKYKKTTHEKTEGAFHGSGDVFASVFTGLLAAGKNAEYAVKSAAEFTRRCIANKKKSGGEIRYGLDFEEEIPFLVKLAEK